MAMQAIQYPTEILSALGKEPEEFEEEARLLLALKYYETGKLSTGTRRSTGRGVTPHIYITSR